MRSPFSVLWAARGGHCRTSALAGGAGRLAAEAEDVAEVDELGGEAEVLAVGVVAAWLTIGAGELEEVLSEHPSPPLSTPSAVAKL